MSAFNVLEADMNEELSLFRICSKVFHHNTTPYIYFKSSIIGQICSNSGKIIWNKPISIIRYFEDSSVYYDLGFYEVSKDGMVFNHCYDYIDEQEIESTYFHYKKGVIDCVVTVIRVAEYEMTGYNLQSDNERYEKISFVPSNINWMPHSCVSAFT